MLNIFSILTQTLQLSNNISLQIVNTLNSISLQSALPVYLNGAEEKSGEAFQIILESINPDFHTTKITIRHLKGAYEERKLEVTFDIDDTDYFIGCKDTLVGLETKLSEVNVTMKLNPFNYDLLTF